LTTEKCQRSVIESLSEESAEDRWSTSRLVEVVSPESSRTRPDVIVKTANPATTLLSITDAATRLGVTERYVRRLVHERRVPFYKVGRLVRFRESDLDRWLETGRVEPTITRSR
jgi:excisionase family DNA binding protein